jgi:hypothetical protein
MLTLRISALEMLRSIIDHKKVFVLALNGPAVGGGAAWFTGVSDIVLVSSSCYLQVPFSALGLVPENGSAINFAQSMGIQYVLPCVPHSPEVQTLQICLQSGDVENRTPKFQAPKITLSS